MGRAHTLLRHGPLTWESLAQWADEKMEGNVETSQQAGGRQMSPLLRGLLSFSLAVGCLALKPR